MHRTWINITDELSACLDLIVNQTGKPLAEVMERLLREHPDVERARKKIKLKFVERTKRGWKPGVKRKPEETQE